VYSLDGCRKESSGGPSLIRSIFTKKNEGAGEKRESGGEQIEESKVVTEEVSNKKLGSSSKGGGKRNKRKW
jgi:hypothetical protein